ncbi:sigma-70 family RNA polymerase sigma factor [Streptomyces sp. NPDC088794]|uniref:sigma-70 family RNA polymerase sigma factor n=1 Tax=Streptomyces sp. NPDC088794 TaxID=3365902 RepID=UPI0037F84E4B
MNDGSTAEYARVYAEQQPRLVAYARSLTRNSWTADDIVAEAHFRVWRRLSAGHEIDNVPAYLMTTVRRLATAAGGAVRETPRDPQTDERAEAGAHGDDPAERVSSVDLLTRVLGELPERWVKALWLAEAEGQPLAAIGPQLGTREGATAVLLHRAREGMRQAFLRTQTGAPDDPACQVHWARMPAYVRGNATARQSERLLGHVDACDDCRERLALLMQTNSKLPALVGPALLVFAVGGAGKWLLSGVAGAAGAAGSAGAAVSGTSGAGASGAGGGAGASGSAASGSGASSGASAGSGAGASAGGSGGASAGAAGSAGGHGAAAGLAGGHSGAAGIAGGHGSAAGVAGGHGGAAGLAGGGHGGGLLHGVKSAVAGGAKAPVAVAAGAAVAGAVAICIALGSVDPGPVTVDKGSVRETPVAQAPAGQPETGDATATPGTTEGTRTPRAGSTPSDVPVPVSYDVGDSGAGAATPVPAPPPLPPLPPSPTPIPTPTSAPSGPGTPAPEPTSPEPSTPEPSTPEPTSPEPTYPEPTSPEPTKPVEEPTEPAPSPSPTDDCPPPVQSAPRYPV